MTAKKQDLDQEIVEIDLIEDVSAEDCQDCDPVEEIVEAAPVQTTAQIYVALEGDTYASIAKKFARPGITAHHYATLLFVENKGKNLTADTPVKL